ncbi:hypothetical protein AAFF_G00062250 [Aldrovandia affinis]|uniref:Uncharacterized protein n=1 Tax=Aldrovandia affinis TaxID=143900 RepID=A0AAD7RZP7_9TELE|nr:hypothetical protein AAFF_G00062250 [Aldrovandia affinis]
MMEDRWRATLREVQQLEQSAQIELCKAKLELSTSEEHHLLAVMKLREEHHMDSLGVLGIMAGEMEKEKASHGDEMRRVESHNLALKEQVRNLTQRLENEQRQCLDMQESQDQATDEYARALGDAQTRLAQKEAELRKAAENHASEAEQLRCRVEQESRDTHQVEANALREQLAQLEKSVEQEKAQNQELQAVQEKALRGESEKHGQQLKELRDQLEKSVEQEKAQNQELQTEQEKLLAQREDVSSQLQEVNRANIRLLEQLTERGQEKDKLQQELEETWKTADKRKAMLDELAIDVAQEKLRHKEELQAQIQSMEGTKGWFERRLKEAEDTAEKSALEHQEQIVKSASPSSLMSLMCMGPLLHLGLHCAPALPSTPGEPSPLCLWFGDKRVQFPCGKPAGV